MEAIEKHNLNHVINKVFKLKYDFESKYKLEANMVVMPYFLREILISAHYLDVQNKDLRLMDMVVYWSTVDSLDIISVHYII